MTTSVDAHRSDFNVNHSMSLGSGGDILWRDHAGDTVLWLMDNHQVDTQDSIATLPFVPPDWHVKAAAEFDSVVAGSAGNSDILWQNDNGALALWQMNGTTVSAIHALPNPGPSWRVVGDNDFTLDGADDIVFQNDNGSLAMWTITDAGLPRINTMLVGTQNPGPTWHVVGTGDSDDDGQAGILWQNDNGALALWEKPTFAAGIFTFDTVAALSTIDPSWHVKGMQDISGDGRADVVFQNDNGAVVIWEMGGAAGTTITSANLVNINPGPAWHIVGLRDMDNDHHIDILFQNDNGAAALWEDYQSLGAGSATFNQVLAIDPNPNPNGHVWDLQ